MLTGRIKKDGGKMKIKIAERLFNMTEEIYYTGYKEGYKEGFEQAIKESDWIMCDDELPVSDGKMTHYLTINKVGIFQVLPYWHGWNRYEDSSGKHEIKDVVAWKPLISPLTESEEEHE